MGEGSSMGDRSRATLLASRATGETTSQLEARLESASVVVSIEADVPGAIETGELLLSTLRRLPGTVGLDPSGLNGQRVEELSETATKIDPSRGIRIGPARPGDQRVRIGSTRTVGTTLGLPDLHGYRLDPDGHDLRQVRSPSGLGIASAAAALAAQVFVRAAGVSASRSGLHGPTAYCPVTLSSRPELGPDLPRSWHLEFLALGLGAIGTASAKILAMLPVEGSADLVDPQRFAPENVATYSLGTETDARDRPLKVDLVQAALRNFTTKTWSVTAAELPALIDAGTMKWPDVVLAGLDSPDGRRDARRIWPDVLIDGATGDTMVGLHVSRAFGQPCMACFFPDRSAAAVVVDESRARAIGLPSRVLADGDRPLTEEILAAADPVKRDALRQHLGKPVCSLVQALGLTDLPDEGYQPAAAFVALTAATLVVGRLVAEVTTTAPPANFVQFDVLAGPQWATIEARNPDPGCDCGRSAEIIERVRAHRTGLRHRPA